MQGRERLRIIIDTANTEADMVVAATLGDANRPAPGPSRDSDASDSEGSEDDTFSLFSSKSSNANGAKARAVNTGHVAPDVTPVHERYINSALLKVPEDMRTFEDIGIGGWLERSLKALGMCDPTPVQRACIPPTLGGRDILASAPTGSGKTAAFALPIIHKLAPDPYGVFAVVLTPTRELAFQIGEQFQALGSGMSIRCEVIVGGMSMVKQAIALKRSPHVIVATPGRLAAHLSGPDPPRVAKCRFLVFDEADRLLNNLVGASDVGQGFVKDIVAIVNALPATQNGRQTLLYSATMTDKLRKIKSIMCEEAQPPFEFHVGGLLGGVAGNDPSCTTVSTLREHYIFIPDQVKHVYLVHLLRRFGPSSVVGALKGSAARKGGREIVVKSKPGSSSARLDENSAHEESSSVTSDAIPRAKSIIVFTSTCRSCQLMSETMLHLRVNCVALHSELTQRRRLAALGKFRSGAVDIMFATDVAARGLDIPEVDLVINYDVPRQPTEYVHRVGRTARAGRSGDSITVVSQFDVELVKAVEALTRKTMKELPTEHDEVMVSLNKASSAMQAAKMRIYDEENKEERCVSWKKRKRRKKR